MAKRRGKARNRQQRRNPQRIDQRPAAAQQPADAGTPLAPTTSGSGAGANDAFERADAEVRASAAPPLASAQRKPKARPADPRITVTGASRLGERAAAEYHYVIRDLRNIGILLIVLAALLAAATVAVNVIGIGRV